MFGWIVVIWIRAQMSLPFYGDDFSEFEEEKPMTWVSCFLYVIANITGLFLYWLYQQARLARLRSEECDYVETTSYNGGITSSSKRTGSQSSLLSVLGLSFKGYRTFFAFEDRFYTFDEVGRACRKAGLDRCSLIVGVDFSASNEWQGRKCFAGQNLHKITPGKMLNPYQKVISIIGRTLETFDDDNLIPAYGFGDSITTCKTVFPFRESDEPCKGFDHVLECYCDIASTITLGGPTNLAPVINQAVSIVEQAKGYHILIIIADGQVTEQSSTVQAIVDASHYPLSIILVGVGDGPWDTMEQFDNSLPERSFDNFQFVNYHEVVRRNRKNPDASFALHAMMEIPDQFKTIKALGYLNDLQHDNDTQSRNGSAAASGGNDVTRLIHRQPDTPTDDHYS